MNKKVKLYGVFLLAILMMIAWAVFFRYYPVEKFVASIGIENTYLVTFILTVVGGFSSVMGTSLYAALIVLAKGSINPIMLGLVGGFGLFVGDSLFFFILSKLRRVLVRVTVKWERVCRKVWTLLYRTPSWIVYMVVFLWVAFAPLPNDLLLAVLALSGYPYKKFAVFLLLGDLTFIVMLTYFSI